MDGRPVDSSGTLLIQRARPGDFLESLPLLERASRSGGPTGLLCSPEIAAWARSLSICETVLTLPGVHPEEGFSGGYPKWRSLVGELRDGHWDRVVHLNHDRGGVALLSASGIPGRYGFTRMADDPEAIGEVPLGWPAYLVSSARGVRRKNRIHLSDVWREFLPGEDPPAERVSCSSQGPVVLVLSGRSVYRQPMFETLESLVRGIVNGGVREVILTGRADEGTLGESLSRLFGQGVRNLAGKTTVGDLDEIVRAASLVISPDTATLHLASFRRIPTIGLFFGGASPHETGARFGRRVSIVSRMSCHPCGAEGSGCQTIACRESMDGALIARVALSLLEKAPLPMSTPSLLVLEGRESDGGFNRLTVSGDPLIAVPGGEGEDALLGGLFRRFFLRLLPGERTLDPLFVALGCCNVSAEAASVLRRLESGARLFAAMAKASVERRVAVANEFPVIWPLAHHLLLDGSGESEAKAFSGLLDDVGQMLDGIPDSGLSVERIRGGGLCHAG